MSQIQIVEQAFMKAHEAGDKENAQILANEVQRLRQLQTAEPKTQQPLENAQTLEAPATQETIQPDADGFDAEAYQKQ